MQILANLILYGFVLFLVYESIFVEHDPFFAFVVLFVIGVAVITTLLPGLHASRTSPGEYPYDD